MLAIPASVSSTQYRPLIFKYPIVFLAPLPFASSHQNLAPEGDMAQENDARSEQIVQSAEDPTGLPFENHITQAAEAYQVDAALIRAIIMVESSNNPKAVSHRGAQGLMQLMPTTARWLGVDDPFDPAGNIDAGVRYFKKLLDRFDGNVKLALAAYNAGSRYVLKYRGVPPFRATRIYIKKVLNYHRQYQEATAASGSALTTG